MIRNAMAAILFSILVSSTVQAQQTYCATPFEFCPAPGYTGYPVGQPCNCSGDVGVSVEIDNQGYYAHDEGGDICYTNFDPCVVEFALIGTECECAGVPGVVGPYQ